MSLRNRLILPVILSSLAVLAACGGGTHNPPVNPPPSGGFTNSNLSGNYVFSVTGTAADQNNDFVTIMGVFTADGNGHITGGVLDQNSTATNGLIQDNIASGTYTVGADGRPTGSPSLATGLLTLQTQNSGSFQFDFVLTSSEHGLVTQFENFGSASGTLDFQSAVTQADINGRSYAFNFTGSSGFDTVFCNLNVGSPGVVVPYATVGAFTLDSTGLIVGGAEDFNNNCLSSGSIDVPVTGGDITLGTSGFGTATITSGSGASAVTYTFDVFPIDATHLKFIETDALPILVGDAFTQSSSIPAGNHVFTVAGFDNATNVEGPFTAAGILHADGNGNILSDSVQDVNDFGVASTVSFQGTYTALTGGRAELTLTGFINGNDGLGCGGCVFAVYPSSGGLQMLEIDDAGSTNGIAYPQTATTLASGEGYGMNLSGLFANTNGSSSEDDIVELTNNNGSFSGIIDFNDQGSTSFKNTFTSTYAADPTVSGRGTVTPGQNAYDLTTYVVDSSTAVVVSTEANLNDTYVALGALVKQNSSASAQSNLVASHLATLRVNASPRLKSARTGSPHTRSASAPNRSK